MKSFKAFLEDFNITPRSKYAVSGKNIDFRGPTPSGFKGSNGLAFPLSSDNIILRIKKRRQLQRKNVAIKKST